MSTALTLTSPVARRGANAAIVALGELSDFAIRANDAHARVVESNMSAVACAVEAGMALNEAKAIVGHGGWLDWLKRNVTFSARTAQNYMRLALVVPNLDPAKAQRVAGLALRAAINAISATNTMRVMCSSDSADWYSPPHIVQLAAKVMNGIDIDPCWHPESSVQATTAYTAAEDGLTKPWHGNVYLNPPYGPAIGPWIFKLLSEHATGTVKQAIALVPARVDTEWFARLDAFPRCFVRGRLQFHNSNVRAPFPSAVIYLGPNNSRFVQVFNKVGSLWTRLADAQDAAP